MKALKYLFIMGLSLFATTACMNDFDDPEFTNPPFGNNTIGEANTTIAQIKEKFANTISGSSVKEITEDIIIEGVVVCNDESGNVYKQFVINDETGAIIIGVNDVGLYAMMQRGQKVRIDCKGLYIGGYGKLAQVGGLYNGSIGRMAKTVFPKHIRLIGTPSSEYAEMTPETITSDFFNDTNKNALPKFVRLENVEFKQADGKALYAPENEAYNNVVERTVSIGKTNIVFRLSTYADFANETLPEGKMNITGVLTRYRDYWQFMLSSTEDIIPVNN